MTQKLWCSFCASFRLQCVTNPLACSALAVAILLWVIPLVTLIAVDSNPIDLLGGDKVEPAVTYPESVVNVTRNVRYKTTGKGVFIRKLRTVGCIKECTEIEMDSGIISFTKGELKLLNTKPNFIPARTPPGLWELNVTLVTNDILGRSINTPLPPLVIQVLPTEKHKKAEVVNPK